MQVWCSKQSRLHYVCCGQVWILFILIYFLVPCVTLRNNWCILVSCTNVWTISLCYKAFSGQQRYNSQRSPQTNPIFWYQDYKMLKTTPSAHLHWVKVYFMTNRHMSAVRRPTVNRLMADTSPTLHQHNGNRYNNILVPVRTSFSLCRRSVSTMWGWCGYVERRKD